MTTKTVTYINVEDPFVIHRLIKRGIGDWEISEMEEDSNGLWRFSFQCKQDPRQSIDNAFNKGILRDIIKPAMEGAGGRPITRT